MLWFIVRMWAPKLTALKEDDFDAFHTAAHKTSGATVKVTVIRANGVPASHVSIRVSGEADVPSNLLLTSCIAHR